MYVYLYLITYIYLSLHYIDSHFVDLYTHNFIDVPGQRKLGFTRLKFDIGSWLLNLQQNVHPWTLREGSGSTSAARKWWRRCWLRNDVWSESMVYSTHTQYTHTHSYIYAMISKLTYTYIRVCIYICIYLHIQYIYICVCNETCTLISVLM